MSTYYVEYDDDLYLGFLTKEFEASERVIESRSDMVYLPNLKEKLFPNLLNIQKENKYTDITVMVDDKPIKAHKIILAMQSPVFDAMLSSKMQESRNNQIKIDDFDHKVVNELIAYMYSDLTPNLEKLAQPLFRAADKYDMGRLKARCEKVLCDTISTENVLILQALAEMHNGEDLKKMTNDFITANITEIQKTKDWNAIVVAQSIKMLQETKMQVITEPGHTPQQEP
ncbi:speckle-type POZ protein-like [Armigeres subalbatus]|uniref:speckle-type POZ protein-like n=1 Tax=Armigeres subalbatus TaxID=124917 RepID=UPI002ED01AAF